MNNWKYAARDAPTDATDGYNGQMSVGRRRRRRGLGGLHPRRRAAHRHRRPRRQGLRRPGPIDSAARRVRLRIEVDTQSVEVFVDDGGVVLSQQVYFEADDAVVRLYAHGGCAVFSNAAFRPARA